MKILVQMTYMNNIGGIETAMYELAKTFKDEDIYFVVNSLADGAQAQIKRLERYHPVIIDADRNGHHEADVALIFTPIMQSVPWDTIHAKKVYYFIHSDIKAYMAYPQWADFKWSPNPKVTKVLSVSETAQKGLKEMLGIDSEIVTNIFTQPERPTVFLYMGRATAEKGVDKVLDLVDRFEKAGKDYILLVSSLVDPYGLLWPRIKDNKRIIMIPEGPYNAVFYKCADYLIQMSTCESWCYSIREALANGVAVIGSRIPEIEKVIKDGENGYLLNQDLSDLDLDRLFGQKPNIKGYSEPLDPNWTRIMKGEL